MICVHHLGAEQAPFWVNPDLLRSIESRPDTVLQFTDGHQVYVTESPEQVVELVLQFRNQVLHPPASPDPGSDT